MEYLDKSWHYALTYFNIASNYYSQILTGQNLRTTLNLYNELEPSSSMIPTLQSEVSAFTNEVEGFALSARGWNTLGMMSNTIGTLGKSANPLVEIVSGVHEFNVNPTSRNAAVILGGAAVGARASIWADSLIFGEGAAELGMAVLAAPELGVMAGAVALGSLGIFAGKATVGLVYDAPQIAERSAERIKLWLKNN